MSQFILRLFLLHGHLTSFLVYPHIDFLLLFVQEAFCYRQAMCHQSEDRLQLCHPNKPSDLCNVNAPLPEIMSALLLCPFEFSKVLAVCWFFCICSFCALVFSANAWNWVLSAGTSLCLRGHCPSTSGQVCLDPSGEKVQSHFALGSQSINATRSSPSSKT